MGTFNSKLNYHELLGSGASGEVFRVTWQSKAHGKVEGAAKKVKFQGEIPEELKREIEYLKKLDHSNIIKYYDTIIDGQHAVIITEYASKGSLYHYLQDKAKLPEQLLHVWIFHLARGIDYLQQNKIAHRDLKSPNCVITADDVIKICDFGISRDLSHTIKEYWKGSVRWLAPEVIRDALLSPKADIFAFAIIVWEMLTCEEPYNGKRTEMVMFQVCYKDLRPEIPADCPSFLRNLLEKCWHADRHMRPACSEIVKMLLQEYHFTEGYGLKWKMLLSMKQAIGFQFLSADLLATTGVVTVYVRQVTRNTVHQLYQLTCDEWRDKVLPVDVAVSDSMPDSILVLCRNSSYVYEFPRHESTEYVKKYQILDGRVKPGILACFAADHKMAVICPNENFKQENAIVVCSLPGFTTQRIVKPYCFAFGLIITTDYLILMGSYKTVVKSLNSVDQDVCRIQPPYGCKCRAISSRNDARQVYVACYHENDKKGSVYKYTWDGNGTPDYINNGCVIANLGKVWPRGLSISADGLLLAVSSYSSDTKVYTLE